MRVVPRVVPCALKVPSSVAFGLHRRVHAIWAQGRPSLLPRSWRLSRPPLPPHPRPRLPFKAAALPLAVLLLSAFGGLGVRGLPTSGGLRCARLALLRLRRGARRGAGGVAAYRAHLSCLLGRGYFPPVWLLLPTLRIAFWACGRMPHASGLQAFCAIEAPLPVGGPEP